VRFLRRVAIALLGAGFLWPVGQPRAGSADTDLGDPAKIERWVARSREQAERLAAREKSLKTEIAAKKKRLSAVKARSRKAENGQATLAEQRQDNVATVAKQHNAQAALVERVADLGATLCGQSLASRVLWRPAADQPGRLVLYLTALEMAAAERERARLAESIRRSEHEGQQAAQALAKATGQHRDAIAETDQLAGQIEQLEKELAAVRRSREIYLRRVNPLTRLRQAAEAKIAEGEKQQQAASAGKKQTADEMARSGLPPAPRPKQPVALPANLREGTPLDLMVSEGTQIHAIEAGRVLFADRFKGYGNLVILEHADGTLSLYGFLDEIQVAAAASVARGQAIGRSGFIEDRDRAGLRFEMRLMRKGRDVVVEPRSWLPEGADFQRRLLRGTD